VNLILLNVDWGALPRDRFFCGDLTYQAHQLVRFLWEEASPPRFVLLDSGKIVGLTEEEPSGLLVTAKQKIAGALRSCVLDVTAHPWPLLDEGSFICRAVVTIRTKGRQGKCSRDPFVCKREAGHRHLRREDVYREWFHARAEKLGLTLEGVEVEYAGLRQVRRRTQGTQRQEREVAAPVALFTGKYKGDPTEAIRRGFGRHKSFGFGLFLPSKGELT
jgi:hypothetical protein